MKSCICSVYDSKAEAFLAPFMSQTRGTAVRMFEAAVSDPTHGFCKHAADYTLFELATWDDQTGMITMHQAHVNLGNGIAYKKHTPEQPVLRALKTAEEN